MTQVPASSHGGGLTAVGCVLTLSADPSIKGAGVHAFLWSGALDNPYDGNVILALPSGLGLSTPLDGATSAVLTTAAGIWSFDLTFGLATDATFQGYIEVGVGSSGPRWEASMVGLTASAQFTGHATLPLPSGASLAFRVRTIVDATAVAYVASAPQLIACRIG